MHLLLVLLGLAFLSSLAEAQRPSRFSGSGNASPTSAAAPVPDDAGDLFGQEEEPGEDGLPASWELSSTTSAEGRLERRGPTEMVDESVGLSIDEEASARYRDVFAIAAHGTLGFELGAASPSTLGAGGSVSWIPISNDDGEAEIGVFFDVTTSEYSLPGQADALDVGLDFRAQPRLIADSGAGRLFVEVALNQALAPALSGHGAGWGSGASLSVLWDSSGPEPLLRLSAVAVFEADGRDTELPPDLRLAGGLQAALFPEGRNQVMLGVQVGSFLTNAGGFDVSVAISVPITFLGWEYCTRDPGRSQCRRYRTDDAEPPAAP